MGYDAYDRYTLMPVVPWRLLRKMMRRFMGYEDYWREFMGGHYMSDVTLDVTWRDAQEYTRFSEIELLVDPGQLSDWIGVVEPEVDGLLMSLRGEWLAAFRDYFPDIASNLLPVFSILIPFDAMFFRIEDTGSGELQPLWFLGFVEGDETPEPFRYQHRFMLLLCFWTLNRMHQMMIARMIKMVFCLVPVASGIGRGNPHPWNT